MHYILLLIAIALEISATTLLGYSDGFTKLVPSAASIIAAVAFDQKLTAAGIVGIVLIITGCILVNLFGAK